MKFDKITIRQASPADADRITDLSFQLGYKVLHQEILERLQKIIIKDNTAVFVAVYNNQVVGWIQVSKRSAIETGELAEITGLVVDEKIRGQGIGKSLVLKSEDWARDNGFTSIRVRTNIIRVDTHYFYKGIGFEEKKKQTVFQKKLV
ncbi:MAG: GNAT family N-acetyltransferase [Bacteroidetes bacterium]|nr:GNAT family N-acetyltransferase [Bacteroidota bacterium]